MDPVPKVLCNKNVGANNLGPVWTAADTSQQRHASIFGPKNVECPCVRLDVILFLKLISL